MRHGRAAGLLLWAVAAGAQPFDLVIAGGRVLDPETGLDEVRHVGIRAGSIAALSESPLDNAKVTIDARGLTVAPGFIDLHWHGRDPASGRWQAMDGVTSALELEVGVADVDAWYAGRVGKSLVNYGASVGHAPVRMAVMKDPGDFLPSGPAAHRAATEEEIAAIAQRIEHGLRRGAVAVGFGIAYTEAASHWEILEMFRVAARYGASCHVHIRGASSAGATGDREQGLSEAIAAAAISGAGLHVVHINSSAQASTGRMLGMIADARRRGLDITTEAYPYTAGATRIESAIFDTWTDRAPADYQRLQWMATGERLTRDTFLRYRQQGGTVIIHANTEERVREAILSPLTMIASDGFDVTPTSGHPRSSGTFTRVLGRFARDGGLPLIEAVAKMTLRPAQRLEARVPGMRRKGRIRLGADADITVFDAARVIDRSTYEKPAIMAEGVRYVLVGGALVVRDGRVVEDVFPGQAIRAPAAE
ncbi:MAG: amidohydrolase family protein [Bryobacteraceae bacterium]